MRLDDDVQAAGADEAALWRVSSGTGWWRWNGDGDGYEDGRGNILGAWKGETFRGHHFRDADCRGTGDADAAVD